jgi:hypothetical protein
MDSRTRLLHEQQIRFILKFFQYIFFRLELWVRTLSNEKEHEHEW